MPIAVLASMSPASSRARSWAIFQLSYQQSTSWSSTSKLPRRSALLCLLRWSLVPTTSSNEVGDVRFWGLADMPEHSTDVRFWQAVVQERAERVRVAIAHCLEVALLKFENSVLGPHAPSPLLACASVAQIAVVEQIGGRTRELRSAHSAITRQAATADAAMADAALAVPAVLVTAAMAASTKLDEMKNSRRNYRGFFHLELEPNC